MSSVQASENPYSFSQTGTFDAPYTLTVPASLVLQADTATATFDGTSASGDFLPCLSFYSPAGVLIASIPIQTATLTAGETAEVSWFPFAPAASSGSGGTGIQFDVDNVGGWLEVETTTNVHHAFSQPSANYNIETTFGVAVNPSFGSLFTAAPDAFFNTGDAVVNIEDTKSSGDYGALPLQLLGWDTTVNGTQTSYGLIVDERSGSDSPASGYGIVVTAAGHGSGDSTGVNVVATNVGTGREIAGWFVGGGHQTGANSLILLCATHLGVSALEVRDDGTLIVTGLPTSATGLPSGSVWNNSGVLNIV